MEERENMLDLHTINIPKLQEEDCDQEAIRKPDC